MTITRSGPPTTHDSRTWRVPLSGPPSIAWQKSFQEADPAGGASPGRVQFEHAALTFRSGDADVPQWIVSIDGWIARANDAETALDAGRRADLARAQEQTDARRQRASDANDRFKNL
jgi:hypothetical protein